MSLCFKRPLPQGAESIKHWHVPKLTSAMFFTDPFCRQAVKNSLGELCVAFASLMINWGVGLAYSAAARFTCSLKIRTNKSTMGTSLGNFTYFLLREEWTDCSAHNSLLTAVTDIWPGK